MGARSTSLPRASDVFALDLASRYFPTVTRVRIMADDSKYRGVGVLVHHRHILVPEPPGHPVHGEESVYKGRPGADGHQGILLGAGAPVPSAPLIELPVEHQTGTVRMSCVRAEIMAFSMPVRMPGTGGQHGPHGHIHKRDKKNDR